MVEKTVYIEYQQSGQLSEAYNVVLASEDGTFGLETTSGTVVLPAGTLVQNPSIGRYQTSVTLQENTTYTVSWQVTANSGDQPTYVIQNIGPYTSSQTIRAVADFRGKFIQGQRATLFIRITDFEGNAQDADPITCNITDSNGNAVVSLGTEKATTGFYAADWNIDVNQAEGNYTATWNYTAEGTTQIEVQQYTVNATQPDTSPPSYYQGKIAEFRESVLLMIKCASCIPVYGEQNKPSRDNLTYSFSFPRWNQSAGTKIYVNNEIQNSGYTVDYFRGNVIFDEPLTRYETVKADYNFRWFSDLEIDRFLSNAVGIVNMYPPASSSMTLWNAPDRYIVMILYAAVVDAIRDMMMCLQFQQPQMVFGGPDGAQQAYANLEGLKKNYESSLNSLLEQKKYGPYVGLTRTIITPQMALPGGRSRYFRYMFSTGTG